MTTTRKPLQETPRNSLRRFSATMLIVLSTVLSGQAIAQGSGDAGSTPLEEITVTGSLIRRSAYDERTPIQTVDRAKLEDIGASQPQDILKTLTVNTGSELYGETTNRAGVSQFNLRGLGVSSTLTLVNGRRAGVAPVGEPTGSDFVDINQFPAIMIERVEVLTDGASATYGSDAVAGVANIITRKGFEGFELSGDFRDASNESFSLNLAAGAKFDQGTFAFYASYYDQSLTDRADFDWIEERILGNGDRHNSRLLSSTGAPGSYLRAVLNANLEPELLPGAIRTTDPDCEAAGGLLVGGICRFDFSDQFAPIAAERRNQFFGEFDYDIDERTTFFAEASYSHNVINARTGSRFFDNGAVEGSGRVFIPGDHPFNFFIEDPADPLAISYIGPATWDPAIHTGVDLVCECRPFGAEFTGKNAPGDDVREFDYFRFVGGFEFELPNNWYANVSYQNSVGKFLRIENGTIRADIFNQLVLDGSFNPFGTRLADPNLISPKDGASTAFNEEGVVLQIAGEGVSSLRTSQNVVDALVTGDIAELSAGPVGLALGAQYRSLRRENNPDSAEAASEANRRATSFPSIGSQDVWAAFVEVVVPVTEFAEVQLALRHEDFGGNVGTTTDPKISAKITATDSLSFRGSYGSSFQAPSLQQTSTTIVGGVVTDSATIGPNGLACLPPGQTGQTIALLVSTQGAPNLTPQSADNFSLGVIFQPLDNLNLSIDYWNYDYTDLIAPSESAQAIVNNDCADGVPDDPRVVRGGAGQLSRVNTEFTNIGSVEASGFDIMAVYNWDTSKIGNITFDFRATVIQDFKVADPVAGNFDGVGNRNFSNNFGPQPEWRANAGASWSRNNHRANLVVRYIDSYLNDQSGNAEIDSNTLVDLQYGIDVEGLIGQGTTSFTIGANNIFDEDPPALVRNDANGNLITGNSAIDRPAYDPRVHDIRGRVLYFGLKQTF